MTNGRRQWHLSYDIHIEPSRKELGSRWQVPWKAGTATVAITVTAPCGWLLGSRPMEIVKSIVLATNLSSKNEKSTSTKSIPHIIIHNPFLKCACERTLKVLVGIKYLWNSFRSLSLLEWTPKKSAKRLTMLKNRATWWLAVGSDGETPLHPMTPRGYPTFLYAKSSKGSSWTKGKLSWISLHSCRKAAWHGDFRPSLSFSCHEVSSHFSLAWSRQNSRVPLNRTTSGVPVSFAFFFPWSRYVSDHQFCGFKPQNPSSVAAKPAFFPISHPKNLRQNLSTLCLFKSSSWSYATKRPFKGSSGWPIATG